MSVDDHAGRVAIVTGATKPMGEAIAARLAGDGVAIVGTGRDVTGGEAVRQRLEEAGNRAVFVPADLGVESDVKRLVDDAVETFGRLDIVVNNAAPTDIVKGGGEAPVVDEPTETFEYMLRVGVLGPFLLHKFAIPRMLAGGGGVFVNVSTAAATLAIRSHPGYAASKAALEALTRQVALDYGMQGIRANAVALGWISDSGAPSNRPARSPDFEEAMSQLRMGPAPGTVQDVAAAVAFLASDDAKYITGATVPVDGGLTAKMPDIWKAFGHDR